jgi:hypothetical protein
MHVETKFLRLFRAVELGDDIDVGVPYRLQSTVKRPWGSALTRTAESKRHICRA